MEFSHSDVEKVVQKLVEIEASLEMRDEELARYVYDNEEGANVILPPHGPLNFKEESDWATFSPLRTQIADKLYTLLCGACQSDVAKLSEIYRLLIGKTLPGFIFIEELYPQRDFSMALEGLIEEYATRAYVILRRTDSTLPFIYECGDEESIRQHLMGLGEDCKDEVDEWMDAIYAELKKIFTQS